MRPGRSLSPREIAPSQAAPEQDEPDIPDPVETPAATATPPPEASPVPESSAPQQPDRQALDGTAVGHVRQMSLGAGIALVGLGLGFLGLRMRRPN